MPTARNEGRSPRRRSSAEAALRESIEEIYKQCGRRIREAREAAELTQENVAELAGISQNLLARIEGGTRRVSLLQLQRIAESLEVPLHTLLPNEGEAVAVPQTLAHNWSGLSTADRRLVGQLVKRLARR